MNVTLNSPIPQLTEPEKEGLYHIYKDKEYFKTLRFKHGDMKSWLQEAVNETNEHLGLSEDLSDEVYIAWTSELDEMVIEYEEEEGHFFDFFKLLFGEEDEQNGLNEWQFSLTWQKSILFKWLTRNWFDEELYWKEDPYCNGFLVDDNPDCDLRPKELKVLTYTPYQCLDGTIDGCDLMVTYVRLSTKKIVEEEALLQFLTTIFTCIILGAGAIMFANDTDKLVIMPITKMVGIIKTLADDPLQKPDPPQFDEEETQQKGQMRTKELQKTIFRIGNLLQMSYGQLGAIIIRD